MPLRPAVGLVSLTTLTGRRDVRTAIISRLQVGAAQLLDAPVVVVDRPDPDAKKGDGFCRCIAIIALPWPWSVPRLPFSFTAPPEFRHRQQPPCPPWGRQDHVTSAAMAAAEVVQPGGELPLSDEPTSWRALFPAADVGERDLEADIRNHMSCAIS